MIDDGRGNDQGLGIDSHEYLCAPNKYIDDSFSVFGRNLPVLLALEHASCVLEGATALAAPFSLSSCAAPLSATKL